LKSYFQNLHPIRALFQEIVMMNSQSKRAKATQLVGALCALAFAAGCSSETGRNVTGPSAGASPSAAGSAVVHAAAGTVRFYTAQAAPILPT
jgi:hypothetical protein